MWGPAIAEGSGMGLFRRAAVAKNRYTEDARGNLECERKVVVKDCSLR